MVTIKFYLQKFMFTVKTGEAFPWRIQSKVDYFNIDVIIHSNYYSIQFIPWDSFHEILKTKLNLYRLLLFIPIIGHHSSNNPFFNWRMKYSKWNSIWLAKFDWINEWSYVQGTWEFGGFPKPHSYVHRFVGSSFVLNNYNMKYIKVDHWNE